MKRTHSSLLAFIGALCWLLSSFHATAQNPPDGSLRLVDGPDAYSGRLEIFLKGEWGTICDPDFRYYSGNVACRQLGHMYTKAVRTNVASGTGAIHMRSVSCIGYENSLMSCLHQDWVTGDDYYCTHTDDVGIECVAAGSLRLADGPNEYSGRLEIFHDGQWGSVCDMGMTWTSMNVACRQLGFSGSQDMKRDSYFGSGTGPAYKLRAFCSGTESSLAPCYQYSVKPSDCSETFGLICVPTPYPQLEFSLRLMSSTTEREGRVEVYHEGEWDTICRDGWDKDDADVVCRQLGYPSAAEAWTDGHFGVGSGKILLNDVNCAGDESSLQHCAHSLFIPTSCAGRDDVGVTCNQEDQEELPTDHELSPLAIGAIAGASSLVVCVVIVILLISIKKQWRKNRVKETDEEAKSAHKAKEEYISVITYGNPSYDSAKYHLPLHGAAQPPPYSHVSCSPPPAYFTLSLQGGVPPPDYAKATSSAGTSPCE